MDATDRVEVWPSVGGVDVWRPFWCDLNLRKEKKWFDFIGWVRLAKWVWLDFVWRSWFGSKAVSVRLVQKENVGSAWRSYWALD